MSTAPTTWRLRLRDRPGAVERLLSVLRRRIVPVEALSMERATHGDLELQLTVLVPEDRRDRIAAEVSGLVDVETCVAGPAATAPPDPSTQAGSTQTGSTQTERTEDHAS